MTFRDDHKPQGFFMKTSERTLQKSVGICLALLFGFAFSVQAAWERVPSPSVGDQANGLLAVAAAGDNDVWATGLAFNESLFAYRTLAEHWNGTRWSVVPSPNATDGYNFLNGVGVVAPNDV